MKSIALSELKNHFDEEVTVSGFVDEVRNLKWVQFVVLRDATGKVQITTVNDKVSVVDVSESGVMYIKSAIKDAKISSIN